MLILLGQLWPVEDGPGKLALIFSPNNVVIAVTLGQNRGSRGHTTVPFRQFSS